MVVSIVNLRRVAAVNLRRVAAAVLALALIAAPVAVPRGPNGVGVSRAAAHPAPDGFADLAEKLMREEVTKAAAEINRLIESDSSWSSGQPQH